MTRQTLKELRDLFENWMLNKGAQPPDDKIGAIVDRAIIAERDRPERLLMLARVTCPTYAGSNYATGWHEALDKVGAPTYTESVKALEEGT